MPRFTHLSLLVLTACVSVACKDRHDAIASPPTAMEARSVATPPASQATPAPSASALSLPEPPSSSSSAPAPVEDTPPGVPYEVRPAVQVKHRMAGSQVLAVTAEPGVLLGPKKQLVKAFDCTSPGAPRTDMFGICVGFKSCQAAPPVRAGVLAEIACKGPELTLQLTADGVHLAFAVADPSHALAKRAMTPIELPAGTRPELLPFERMNRTNYVDL